MMAVCIGKDENCQKQTDRRERERKIAVCQDER